MILSIDPGSRPGFALLDERQLLPRPLLHAPQPRVIRLWFTWHGVLNWWLSHPAPFPASRPRRVIVEGQWVSRVGSRERSKRVSAQSVVTLSATANVQGQRAADYFSCPWYRAEPKIWQTGLGWAGCSADVIYGRIWRCLTPEERLTIDGASPERAKDLLAAIGIGWGAHLAHLEEVSAP